MLPEVEQESHHLGSVHAPQRLDPSGGGHRVVIGHPPGPIQNEISPSLRNERRREQRLHAPSLGRPLDPPTRPIQVLLGAPHEQRDRGRRRDPHVLRRILDRRQKRRLDLFALQPPRAQHRAGHVRARTPVGRGAQPRGHARGVLRNVGEPSQRRDQIHRGRLVGRVPVEGGANSGSELRPGAHAGHTTEVVGAARADLGVRVGKTGHQELEDPGRPHLTQRCPSHGQRALPLLIGTAHFQEPTQRIESTALSDRLDQPAADLRILLLHERP